MKLSMTDYYAELSRRQTEVKQAEAYRVARAASRERPAEVRLGDRFLAWFGAVLVLWGRRLQSQAVQLALPCPEQRERGDSPLAGD